MSVIFLSQDLVFSSRLAAAGEQLDIAVSAVSSLDAAVAQLSGESVRLVVVDLSAGDLDVTRLVPRLRESQPSLAIVAFAPHVHESRLQAATDAGCDQVLTRGQFDRQMEDLLVRYAGSE